MNISKDKSLLKFHLESIEAGGSDLVDGDDYEMVGENEASWDVSISSLCGAALNRIEYLEHQLARHSMDAGQAEQRRAESRAARLELGFPADSDDVSPSDLRQAFARRDAEKQAAAFRRVAAGLDPESDEFTGPTYHEAEMIGMEISGPTNCSDARRCMRAGRRAFLEAARIWEYMAKEDVS